MNIFTTHTHKRTQTHKQALGSAHENERTHMHTYNHVITYFLPSWYT